MKNYEIDRTRHLIKWMEKRLNKSLPMDNWHRCVLEETLAEWKEEVAGLSLG